MHEHSEKRFKAVIFDLDGTLLDTLRDIAEAMNRTLVAFGLKPYPIEAYKNFVGEGARVLAEKVLPQKLRTKENIEHLRQQFINDYRSNWNHYTKPYDGIPELIDTLVQMGIDLAVLSNKPHEFTTACVESFLAKWPFKIALGEKEDIPRKPDPKGATIIAKELDILPSEIIFVGDTKIDMVTAQNAKMFPCGVLWGFRTQEELLKNGAKALLKKPMDLINLFHS